MEEVKSEELDAKVEQEEVEKNDKKVTFTLLYILAGILTIAILATLLYAFIVTS